MSADNIIGESFAEIMIPPLIPPKLTTHTQACATSIQVSSGPRAEEINKISRQKDAPIELKVTSTVEH